jgi:hypothetical protein
MTINGTCSLNSAFARGLFRCEVKRFSTARNYHAALPTGIVTEKTRSQQISCARRDLNMRLGPTWPLRTPPILRDQAELAGTQRTAGAQGDSPKPLKTRRQLRGKGASRLV